MASDISPDELIAHLKASKIVDESRPDGFYTKKEMGNLLFRMGEVTSPEAGTMRVQRMLNKLDAQERLDRMEVITTAGLCRRPHVSFAFKILPAPKAKTGKSR
jgi:hypothetical protein